MKYSGAPIMDIIVANCYIILLNSLLIILDKIDVEFGLHMTLIVFYYCLFLVAIFFFFKNLFPITTHKIFFFFTSTKC